MTLLNVSIKLGFAVPVPMKIGSKLATFVFKLIHNEDIYALSFYVTKTVLVSPKLFWSDQINLDLTIMIWS